MSSSKGLVMTAEMGLSWQCSEPLIRPDPEERPSVGRLKLFSGRLFLALQLQPKGRQI